MEILTESQPVAHPNYVHLAYTSAEMPATVLLSVGVLLGFVILLKAAWTAFKQRLKKRAGQVATASQPKVR